MSIHGPRTGGLLACLQPPRHRNLIPPRLYDSIAKKAFLRSELAGECATAGIPSCSFLRRSRSSRWRFALSQSLTGLRHKLVSYLRKVGSRMIDMICLFLHREDSIVIIPSGPSKKPVNSKGGRLIWVLPPDLDSQQRAAATKRFLRLGICAISFLQRHETAA